MNQLRLDGDEDEPGAAAAPADEARRPWRLVDLNATDYARADECARGRNRMELAPGGDDAAPDRFYNLRDADTALLYNTIGAQGELALAKLIGTRAPLDVGTFRSRPDVPPHWDVKTQLAYSQDTLAGYLRLRPRGLIRGRRHVFVVRDVRIDGSYVFVVHGFVTTEKAREVGRRRFAYSDNLHVHVRHLEPVEPLCELDVEALQEVAARWTFDDEGKLKRA